MNANDIERDFYAEMKRTGTKIQLRRKTSVAGAPVTVDIMARVQFEAAVASQGAGNRSQRWRVIHGMKEIREQQWPDDAAGTTDMKRLPVGGSSTDFVRIDGADFSIESVTPVYVGQKIVRVELEVKR